MASSYTWLSPILGTVIAALFTYLIAIRKSSGRIDTTEASKLWEEAADIRDVYRHEIAELRGEVHALKKHNRDLNVEIRALQGKLDECARKNIQLQIRVEELEDNATV